MLDVPAGAPAGHVGARLVVAGPERIELPIDLRVWGFDLPAEPTFHMELNTYGWPDTAPTLWAIQRVARRFRSYVNVVPYGHSGRTRMDMRLPDGRRQDEAAFNDIEPGAMSGNWDEFVEAFDPILGGGAFPVGGFYLPFHENWPLPMNAHRVEDEIDAYAVFDEIYAATWSAVLGDFARLAGERGWGATLFQVYLNNKPGPNNPTPWSLDEPASYWDFRALDYFAGLFDAAAPVPGVDLRFRADVSRPEYHRGYLERVGLYVCSVSALSRFPRVLDAWRRRTGGELWSYGSPNLVTESNHHVQAWALRTFALGGDGVLPWQTVSYDPSLLEGGAPDAQRLALLVVSEDALEPVVYPSLRLAAYRRAQQDIEYLRILQRLGGYTRGQMAGLVASYLGPAGDAHRLEAAAAIPLDGHHEGAFEGLRVHAAQAIEALLEQEPVPPPDGGPPVDLGVTDSGPDAALDGPPPRDAGDVEPGADEDPPEEAQSSDGCGCSTPGGGTTVGWFALLLLAPHRRRGGRGRTREDRPRRCVCSPGPRQRWLARCLGSLGLAESTLGAGAPVSARLRSPPRWTRAMRPATRSMLMLLICGCAPAGGGGGGGGVVVADDGGARDGPVSTALAPLKAVYAVPEVVVQQVVAAGRVLVNALFVASVQGGGGERLVTTGTVSQEGEQWVWSAEPDDALVVHVEGQTLRFAVEEVQAADLSSPDAVLGGDHRLVFEVEGSGGRVHVSSVKQGAERDVRIDGTLRDGGVDYALEGLRYRGTEHFESDTSGHSYDNAYLLTGTIRWADVRLALDEQWRFELVTAAEPRPTTAQSAERINRSVLDVGAVSYTWIDATTRKAFRNGKPSSEDYWAALGEVRRDGEAFGEYRMTTQSFGVEGAGLIRFVVVLPDETIELERIQAW